MNIRDGWEKGFVYSSFISITMCVNFVTDSRIVPGVFTLCSQFGRKSTKILFRLARITFLPELGQLSPTRFKEIIASFRDLIDSILGNDKKPDDLMFEFNILH